MSIKIEGNIPGKGYTRLEIEGDRIAFVQPLDSPEADGVYISPGFVDIQLNGFSGIDFSSPTLTPEQAIKVLPFLWETGVTTFCPTLITNSHERLLDSIRVLERARRIDSDFEFAVPCYHLEGPYLSPLGSRGAHDPKLMRSPDWDEFTDLQIAAHGRIGIVTVAPELPGALEFIRKAKTSGMVVAIGHTDATPEQIHMAADAGATLSTHWGNGCPEYIHRHNNPLWAQLAIESMSASLICDGFHLPPDAVKVAARVKGIGKCILTTDAVHVANLSPGRYALVGTEIELLPSGQVVTVDGRCMAGSSLTMNRAARVFMEFAQVPLHDAIEAAAVNPANLVRRIGVCSHVAEGEPANLILFRLGKNALEIDTVIFRGSNVYVRDGGKVGEASKSTA
jgi:N-acetylglucosamine-6-phosphate deacetylase